MAETTEGPVLIAPILPASVQPIRHWRVALRRAWSVRFIALFTVASAMSAVWPNLGGYMDPLIYNLIGCLLGGLAFVSVFVQQAGFPKAKLTAAQEAATEEQKPDGNQ